VYLTVPIINLTAFKKEKPSIDEVSCFYPYLNGELNSKMYFPILLKSFPNEKIKLFCKNGIKTHFLKKILYY